MNRKRILGAFIVFSPILILVVTRPLETLVILGGIAAVIGALLIWFYGLSLLFGE